MLVEPRIIREVQSADRETLYTAQTEAREVLSPEVAATMVSLLEGTVLHGTGRGARSLGRPVGGKTGTTDDYNNAWFIGFTPSVAVGVWVGHPDNSPLGKLETGARAALPIWTRFLERGLEGTPVEDFVRPAGIRRALVDAKSGLRARRGAPCGRVILEIFPRGQEPVTACNTRQNQRLGLPYPLQVYPISEEGALLVPPRDVARLITRVPGKLQLIDRGQRIRWNWGEQKGSMPLGWNFEQRLEYYDYLTIAHEEMRQRALAEEEYRENFATELEENPPPEGEEPPDIEKLLPAAFRDGVDGYPALILEVNRTRRVRWPALPKDPR